MGRLALISGKPPRRAGFSLVELMVVVSIIAIIASIAVPKYADLMRKSQEAQTKGNLASLRGAMSVYYSDNQGVYPSCVFGPGSNVLSTSVVPNYIGSIQNVTTVLHPPTNSVYCDSAMLAGNVHDGQGWYYDGDPADARVGNIYVACDHTDTMGNFWSSY
jgi:general secretion pathway protein G